MHIIHKHGISPFKVAVLHGGPGASGSAASLARGLSRYCGVLEPWQSADSIAGQVMELWEVLLSDAENPVVLIGHSWGAWLGYIFAALHPELVRKLILVGCGPFEESYALGIMKTRLSRLSPTEQEEAAMLLQAIDLPEVENRDAILARFGKLMSKCDSFDPLPDEGMIDGVETSITVFQGVMGEVIKLRRSGELLEIGRKIIYPVLAIHGDYDPHPIAGVVEPLGRVLKDFRYVVLKDCGHEPWRERAAQDEFYDLLKQECLA